MDKYQTLLFRQVSKPQVISIAEGVSISYTTATRILIFLMVLLRMVLASVVELGTDEAYYWLYTQRLQWNYFDHPPMVALWGKMFTVNLRLDEYELFVRMGSILGCAVATWFIFRATELLHSARAGWFAAVLYSTSFYAAVVAGLLIMPDAPQMVFWTFSMWMIARLLKNDHNWGSWLLLGLAAGLCIMSKVHGVFIWVGLGLYALLYKRPWLLRPQFYAAVLVTAVVASPILVWNLQHDFVTYRFHSDRVTINNWGMQPLKFLRELAGQFLFNNPVQVVLIAGALTFGRRHLRQQKHHLSVLVCMALPLIFVLLFVSLFRTVFPHWSGPAYVSLVPVAAIYLAQIKKIQPNPLWLRWSMGAFLVFALGWPLVNQAFPGTWGSKQSLNLGKGDESLDRFGWEEGGEMFGRYYRKAVAQKLVAANTPVICNTWWGAHVEYYFCRPQQLTMIGLGSMQQVHHYLWTNSQRQQAVNFDNAFCIVPSDEYYDVQQQYAAYYEKAELVQVIALARSNRLARKFLVYRLSGWKGVVPTVQ